MKAVNVLGCFTQAVSALDKLAVGGPCGTATAWDMCSPSECRLASLTLSFHSILGPAQSRRLQTFGEWAGDGRALSVCHSAFEVDASKWIYLKKKRPGKILEERAQLL